MVDSILTSPLQVGIGPGMVPSASVSPQAAPSDPFASANAMTQDVTPDAVKNAYQPTALENALHAHFLQKYARDAGLKWNEATQQGEEDFQNATDKTPQGKQRKSLSQIFYSLSPQTARRAMDDKVANQALQERQLADDYKNMMLFTAKSQGLSSGQIDALTGTAAKLTKIKKDQMDASAEAPLKAAQAAQALGAAALSNVNAAYKPDEVQNQQNKTTIDAGKLYFDMREAERKYQLDTTKENREAYAKAQEDYIRGVEANTKVRQENRIGAGMQAEQIANPATRAMVPKNPGFNPGSPLKPIHLVPPVPPPPSGTASYLNTPQDQQVLNMAGNISGMGAAKPGQFGQQVSPTTPPPSLVGPQRPVGTPLISGVPGGVPGPPPVQGQGQSQAAGQQPEINPKDIPIPFSIQTFARKVPPLNQQKAKMMVEYYQEMIAKGHPEVEALKDLTEGLNSLMPKLTAKK
jgi:hypothetical protein